MFYKMYRFFQALQKSILRVGIFLSIFKIPEFSAPGLVGNPSLRQSKWMQPRLGSTRMQLSLAAQFKLKTLLKL